MPVVPPYFIELTTSFCNADKRFDSVGCKATSSSTSSLYQIHFCLASSDFIVATLYQDRVSLYYFFSIVIPTYPYQNCKF